MIASPGRLSLHLALRERCWYGVCPRERPLTCVRLCRGCGVCVEGRVGRRLLVVHRPLREHGRVAAQHGNHAHHCTWTVEPFPTPQSTVPSVVWVSGLPRALCHRSVQPDASSEPVRALSGQAGQGETSRALVAQTAERDGRKWCGASVE